MTEREAQLLYALALALAAGLAWALGGTKREHRIVGALLSWQLAVDVARMALAPSLDEAGAWPYAGATLASYFVDHALELSVRFTILAAVAHHFARVSVQPVALAMATSFVVLVTYKLTTGATLVPLHQLIAALSALACAAIVIARVLGWRAAGERPDGAHAALMVLVTTDVANSIAHASERLEEVWVELRYADTAAVSVVAAGYGVALLRDAGERWRRAS